MDGTILIPKDKKARPWLLGRVDTPNGPGEICGYTWMELTGHESRADAEAIKQVHEPIYYVKLDTPLGLHDGHTTSVGTNAKHYTRAVLRSLEH